MLFKLSIKNKNTGTTIVIMTLCCGPVRNYSNGVSDSKSRKNTFVTHGAQSSVLFTKGKQDRILSLEMLWFRKSHLCMKGWKTVKRLGD